MLLVAGGAAGQPCEPRGADARAIERVRAEISERCRCGESGVRGAHFACAAPRIDAAIDDGTLRIACRRHLRRYAKRSVCNVASGVVCCITDAAGATRATVKRKAQRCRAPAGGSACVSRAQSSVGACEDGGCVPSCGNGIVELHLGETCDPPNGGSCSAQCESVATCGNGVVEPFEECDGQPDCGAGCRIATSSCCQLGEFCYDGASDHGGLDDYFFWKGCQYILGGRSSPGVCQATAPCGPDLPDFCRVGSCEDVALEPLQLCCQEPGGCRSATAASHAELSGFGCANWIELPDIGPLRWQLIGACGADGRCVPAS